MRTRNKQANALLTGALTLAAAWLLLPGASAQDATATPDTTATTPNTSAVDAPAVTAPLTPQIAATSDSDSDQRQSNRFHLGPEVGVYLPTNSRTRDRFGDAWLSVGLGLGSIHGVSSKGQLGFDLSLNYQQHNDNRVFLMPLGIGYRVALTQDPEAKSIPYAGVTGDVYLADVRSVPDNVHSGLRAGGGGSVLLGVNFGQTGNLEARYQFVSKIQTFDFSGLSLRAGYRF
ncbi:MAG: hypothetical protein M3Y28_00660 [Armatimonadota bacterium]|nr:hypothetical protein [Armatimonadota bacterium]